VSQQELQSLMGRARQSLRSAWNLLAAFGQYLVKSGKFAAEQQRALQAAFRDRSAGDYAGAFPSREEVERRLADAEQFLLAVTDFLRSEGVSI
jgi:uncharacterized protein (UPF0332 family)